MSSPALSLEATTIQIAQEIEVRASIEVTFAARLVSLGRTTRLKWRGQ